MIKFKESKYVNSCNRISMTGKPMDEKRPPGQGHRLKR